MIPKSILIRTRPLLLSSRLRILPTSAARSISGSSIVRASQSDSAIHTIPDLSSETTVSTTDSTIIPTLLQEPTHVNSILASTHYVLEGIHSAGLPWWATIFCATFLLRTAITTPVAIYQQRAVGRMMALTPVLQAWLETLKTSIGVDHKLKGRDYASFNSEIRNAYRAKAQELYATNRCNPRVSFLLPWVQIPLFITMSLTIRGMAGYPLPFLGDSSIPIEPGFVDGGAMWFTDLAASDPTWIMPLAIGATNLLNVELNGLMMSKTPTRNQRIFRNIFRALAITMIPIAHEAPMAICLYWLSSGSYSVLQNIAFRVPAVRQRLRLPPLPNKALEIAE
ncbi:Cytochrome c oxidase assembly protein cox18, mitochondrial [Mortierella sp. GBA30]|nr:Cytochrome c oxidase assembly protein cox18, mitochondrial [Mortierella sp. GBA30]